LEAVEERMAPNYEPATMLPESVAVELRTSVAVVWRMIAVAGISLEDVAIWFGVSTTAVESGADAGS
jgi:hypothetical protein